MENMETALVESMKSYLRGETTWAQLEGMTLEEARGIAQLGCDLAEAGRLEEARILFEGLVAGNPKDASSQAALGTVYQKLGRLDEALAAYEAALAVDARHVVALTHRGELRLRRGESSGWADVENAAAVDPRGETAAGRRAHGWVTALRERGLSKP
jgi:tetratricopeptide (TPR) repeat protein